MHNHNHSHSHAGHHHGDLSQIGEKRLWWAVLANMGLTVAQIIGGIVSGSLSLIADALHNFSDAASLLIALIAIRIGRRPPDRFKTFGYKRAETIAALINLTTLILIGLYLVIEAFGRFYTPQPIAGWTVIIVAGIALVIDVFTAILTYSQSKHSMNIKAAFLHNVTDAMASVGVILAGTLILLYDMVWVDAAVTLLIAGYVLWQGFAAMPQVIHLLMEGTPPHIELDDVINAMNKYDGITGIHHVHIWQIDEQRNALQAHIVIEDVKYIQPLKTAIKTMLNDEYAVGHSTLEFELQSHTCHHEDQEQR